MRARLLLLLLLSVVLGAAQAEERWSLEAVEAYLKEAPAPVAEPAPRRRLSLELERAVLRGEWSARVAEGPQRFPGAPLAAAGWRLHLPGDAFLSLEGALGVARPDALLGDRLASELSTKNLAIHTIIGLGFEF